MGLPPSYNPITLIRAALTNFLVRLLTKPLKRYTLAIPNDLANLRRHIRKGDVVLVEGNERISECVKYLTQSSWSHAALFVGDEPLRRDPERRMAYLEQFGEDAEYLLVEALVESGVILAPLSKYRDFNIRVCRPYNLLSSDVREILEVALSHVGDVYDIKNALDLARYFLPVSLVPRRFRRHALQFGSGEPTRVICSSLIAECFDRVGFPIIPKFAAPESLNGTSPVGWRSWLRLPMYPYRMMHRVSPTLVTPRDFDVSPYFQIIKFNVIENLKFDYRKIPWAGEEQEQGLAAKKPA